MPEATTAAAAVESSAAVEPSRASNDLAPTCPEGRAMVAGGRFWVGIPRSAGVPEESPRFETQVASFCLDRTEVTVRAYAACVAAGSCTPARDSRRFCNAGRAGREEHPINCVDWNQAAAYCKNAGGRLPAEVEWEYAARGGTEYRRFSWGDESPDGRACWKHPGGSCAVGRYAAGAFGLLDMTGNVWEWTDSWYGSYPWPPQGGTTKVYRGGSWSRRFEKWMRPTLRNRSRPSQWGSHLGLRCASTVPGTSCPFGTSLDGAGCRHGVTDVECGGRTRFNGARCAREGVPRCRDGFRELPGHGCVSVSATADPDHQLDLAAVSQARSPEFDPDCEQYYPGRPRAYRYSGSSHAARNVVSARAGCKNRDVGAGWNSSCCP